MVAMARQRQGVTGLIMTSVPEAGDLPDDNIEQRASDFVA